MVEIQKYPFVRKREDIWKLETLKSDWALFTYISFFFHLRSIFLQAIGQIVV